MFRRNPVQSFIRNLVRLVILVPLWLLLVWSDLDKFESMYIWIAVKSIFLLWFANVFAKMFFIIPQWQRIVLLRLGKSVGARGPGHLKFAANLEGTEIVAICDLYEDLVVKWSEEAKNIGKGERHQNIRQYYGEENKWKEMQTNSFAIFFMTIQVRQ